MGYSNRFTGAITITPPLTWSEIQDGPKLQDVQLRVHEEKRTAVVDGVEAEVIIRTCDAIVPLDMEYSGHQLEEDIQAVIDHYEGYGFAGFIEAQWDPGFGEPPSRFIVKDDRVMRIDAQYRWPGIWADEHDDPFAMIAEDCPAGPARAVVEHWFSHAALISDSIGSPEWRAVADMTRRVLDLMDAERDERNGALNEVTTELDVANDNADAIADQRTEYREEVMRLRARGELSRWLQRCAQAEQRAETAERELAEVRERIGQESVEWGVRIYDDDPDEAIESISSQQQARQLAVAWQDEIEGSNPTAVSRTRYVGKWKASDHA